MKGLFGDAGRHLAALLAKGDKVLFFAMVSPGCCFHDGRLVGGRHQGKPRPGDHTPVVSRSACATAWCMFIASEVMFFVAWFWIFFEMALFNEARAHIA